MFRTGEGSGCSSGRATAGKMSVTEIVVVEKREKAGEKKEKRQMMGRRRNGFCLRRRAACDVRAWAGCKAKGRSHGLVYRQSQKGKKGRGWWGFWYHGLMGLSVCHCRGGEL